MSVNVNKVIIIIQILLYLLLVSCLIVGDTYLLYMIFNSSSNTCEGFVDTPTPTPTPTLTPAPTSTLSAVAQAILAAQAAAQAAQAAAKLAADAANEAAKKAADAAEQAKLQAIANDATKAAADAQQAYQSALNAKTPEEAQAAAKLAAQAAANASSAYDRAIGKKPPVYNNYSTCYELTDTQLGFAKFKMVLFWVLYSVITIGIIYLIYRLFKYDYHVLFATIMTLTVILSVFILVGGVFMTRFVFYGGNKSCKDSAGTQFCYNLNDAETVFARLSTLFGVIYTLVGSFVVGMFIWEANFG